MVRYEKRTIVERSFSRLKEEFGAKFARVRGYEKVLTHLMFGVLVLAVSVKQAFYALKMRLAVRK